MSKNKRMIYILDENVEFYDNLPNKSEVINKRLTELRNPTKLEVETELERKLRQLDGYKEVK